MLLPWYLEIQKAGTRKPVRFSNSNLSHHQYISSSFLLASKLTAKNSSDNCPILPRFFKIFDHSSTYKTYALVKRKKKRTRMGPIREEKKKSTEIKNFGTDAWHMILIAYAPCLSDFECYPTIFNTTIYQLAKRLEKHVVNLNHPRTTGVRKKTD